MYKEYKGVIRGIITVVVIAVILLINPFVIIPAGHRGIVLNWGAVSGKVLEEGIHFVTPIVQEVKEIDVRTVKLDATASSYSKDLQTVDAAVVLNYHVTPESVNTLYQTIGLDYEARIVSPAVQESVKSVIAQFTAQELVEKRAAVKDGIVVALRERLEKDFIRVDDFSITNFDFADAYEKAIEEKQVSQQNALKAENDLKRIQVEADQRVAQAQAEAEAIKIQAQAITQQGGKDYVALKWIEKWDGKLPTTALGETTPMVTIK